MSVLLLMGKWRSSHVTLEDFTMDRRGCRLCWPSECVGRTSKFQSLKPQLGCRWVGGCAGCGGSEIELHVLAFTDPSPW